MNKFNIKASRELSWGGFCYNFNKVLWPLKYIKLEIQIETIEEKETSNLLMNIKRN